MTERGSRVSTAAILTTAALTVWGLGPLVLLLLHAAGLHAAITGADGLIGADGVQGADQLQYLAWIRDASTHSGLASDLFTLTPSAHVYLEPLFALSGLLVDLGASVQLAYLLWKPIAILALLGGATVWARRLLGHDRPGQAAAVVLSLFVFTPLAALFSWTQAGAGPFRFNLYLLADELLAADKLWGYVPSAIGLALVPVCLVCLERALDPGLGRSPARRAISRGADVRPLLAAALAGGLASWLHPWQGITLLIILGGIALLARLRQLVPIALVGLPIALALAYYYWLSHHDPSWHLASRHEVIPRLPALVLLAGLGPLALFALPGLRRPGGVIIEQALLLWIAGCLITYWVNDAFASHALQGLSLPLAVLAVRGWRRLALPGWLGLFAVVVFTVPGLVYDARKLVRTMSGHTVQYYLPSADAAALAALRTSVPPGGVLAPTPFAAIIPGQTGRRVWTGHGYWSTDYPAQAREVDRLFGGRMGPASARAFVASTHADLLLADCGHRHDLTRDLRPRLRQVRRFGCARLYILAPIPR
jgi:hypothetical protein